jgi:indole-3-glycerol phosphate synthase
VGLLDDMANGSAARVAAARALEPEAAVRERALASPAPLPLRLSAQGFDLIAELKLRSPALGELAAQTRDPLERLLEYARGGAAAVSVLTEPTRFDGRLEHLAEAAALLRPLGVPTMRKDFLVDRYQLYEARANGASGVLLIVRMLPLAELAAMLDVAAELGLFVLLEAFYAGDLELAATLADQRLGRGEQVLMGLNCRDLQSLQIDFARFAALRGQLPVAWPAVAESGVQSPADAAAVAALGYRLALVGTSLMRRADPENAVAELLAAGRAAARAAEVPA